MIRTWWVQRLFGRTPRPIRRTRPAIKPTVHPLEDRTVPATLTEAGTILTIDLDTAGELVTSVSLGGQYQFTTSGTFTDGGVTPGNFTGLGTDTVTLLDSSAYTEVRFTDSQPNGTVRFADGGGNTYDQPFTVTLDDPGSAVEFAGTSNFDTNALTVTAAGPITQTSGDLTAGDLAATGSAVNLTAGTNSFISVRGGATAGRFDLTAGGGFLVATPGITATDTVALTLTGAGDTLTTFAPIVSDTGNVELVADNMTIAAAVQAAAAGADIDHGNVVLLTQTPGRPITIAPATPAGKLSISAAEFAQLTAGRLVQVGDPLAGDLTVTQAITAPAGFSKLILGTGGNLTQSPTAAITVGALGLFLDVAAATPQTATLTAAGNDFRTLAIESKDTAAVTVTDTGDLTVDAVGTIAGAVANNLTLTTTGGLTLANTVSVANTLDLTAGGAISQTAGSVAAARLKAAAGSVDVTLGGNAIAQVSGSTTAGTFLVTTATDLEVVAPGITSVGTVTLSAGSGKAVTINAPVLSTTGNAEIIADDAAINDTFRAPFAGTDTDHGNVYLLVQTGGLPMALAAAPVAGKFSVSADELALLTAGRLVQIGDNIFSGDVAITQGFTAPAGFTRFLIGSAGNVTQDATAGIAVDSFGVFLADGGDEVADLTAAGNDVRVFAGEGGDTDDITFASTGPLAIGSVGTVVGLTGRTLTVVARSPLTVAADVNGVGDVTLIATDSAAAGDDLTVNPGVTVRSQTGTLMLLAGDNLTAGAGAVLKADAGAVNLFVDFGDADPGVGATADISQAVLFAPLGLTLTGGPDADTFTVAASADAAVSVNGLTPSLPTLPGDTLNFVGSGGAVTFTPGATPDAGTLQDGALKPVTFVEIETLNLSNIDSLVVNGTNGPDTLVLFQAGGTTFFQLNGANPVAVGAAKFTFNGLAANDTMIVDYKGGDPVPANGAFFDGTDKAGDVFCLLGKPGFSATYLPDATTTGKGTVTVNGKVTGFQNVGNPGNTVGIDIVGFDSATLLTPNANDQLTVTNGTTFCPPNAAALVVTGASGLTPITPVAFRGNGTLTLDTETGSPGNDTVTVASADDDHQNTNLTITTGAGADAVTVNGATKATGDILIASKDISVFAKVESTGGTVTLTNAGTLLIKAATVAGNKGVTQNGTGPVLLINDVVLQSAAGLVSVATTIDAAPLNTGTLTVTAPDAVAGVVTLSGSVGATGRLDKLTVTAGKQVALNGQQYQTFGDQTYSGPTAVSAGTVAFDATAGRVTFLNTLDGAAAGTSAVTVTTPGDTVFGGPVGAGSSLLSLTTDGGGTTSVNGGAAKTAADQVYQDAVVVGADTTFTAGGKVTFANTLDGAFAVTVSAAGLTTFAGKVGNAAPLASLTVNNGGTTAVSGGLVKTAGFQRYDEPVTVGKDATFLAGGDVTFAATLDGGFAVTVTSPGRTTFTGNVGGNVALASLTTDGGLTTEVNSALVVTVGKQVYADEVVALRAGSTQFTAGGDVRFLNGLSGPMTDVTVATGSESFFAGGVAVHSLTTDAAGTTRVAGGTVSGTNGLAFNDPVTADAATLFSSSDANIAFNSTLSGAAVTTFVAFGRTVFFNAPVAVVALTTNRDGGTAQVNTNSVTATGGDLTFNTDVTTVPAAVTFAGQKITFNGKLTGTGTDVTLQASGTTTINGAVSVGSLTTGNLDVTLVNNTTVTTVGTQTYNNGFNYTGTVALRSTGDKAITFQRSVTGATGAALTVTTAGPTTFNLGPVNVAALTTDGGGTTVVNTDTFAATGAVQFNDPVAVQRDVAFTTTGGGSLTFGSTLDGGFGVAVGGPGPVTFGGAVGGAVPLRTLTLNGPGPVTINGGLVQTTGKQTYAANVTANGRTTFVASDTITIQNKFTGTTEIVLIPTVPAGTAVSQSAGSMLTVPLLTLGTSGQPGAGVFLVDSPLNAIDTLQAVIGPGAIYLSTAGDLALAGGGVTTAGGDVRIRTGGGFAADGGTGAAPAQLVNLTAASGTPTGRFAVFFGLNGLGATAAFTAEIKAAKLSLGTPTNRPTEQPFVAELAALQAGPLGPDGQPVSPGFAQSDNTGPDRAVFRPSATTPFFLFGNLPLQGAIKVDTLSPVLDAKVIDFQFDGEDGLFNLDGRKLVQFFNFEGLGGLAQTAFAVQTGEAGDGTKASTQVYSIRVVRTQTFSGVDPATGRPLTTQQLPGGLDGQRLPDNPFVVSPSLVNPAAPTQPPRVAFGFINSDSVPDLILANGPGTPSLVTIINGNALDQVADGVDEKGQPKFKLRRIEELAGQTDRNGVPFILAQFYAFEPTFQGGVNVAAGDFDGDGLAEVVVSADTGGGPRVRILKLTAAGANSPTPFVPADTPFADFFAYEPSFRGGVRVAVGDIVDKSGQPGADGVAELFVVPGVGGGPRVRVFQAASLPGAGRPDSFADFFTVEPTFRGGLYVDAGRYNPGVSRLLPDPVDDIVVGAAGGGGPRVMVFDGRTITRGTPTPTVLADFFAFTDAELTDPFLPGGARTGVGGVTFGPRNAMTGYLDIVASTARGPKVQVRQLPGNPATLDAPGFQPDQLPDSDLIQAGTTFNSSQFTDAPLRGVGNTKLTPGQLTYGATVGGFIDPNS